MKIPLSRLLSIASVPILVGSLFFAVYVVKKSQGSAVLPDYGPVPIFTLTDQNNSAFDSKSLQGKPWIAAFMFTRCPDMCPLMSLKLGKLAKRIQNVNYVSFTSDPDFDKPEVLAEYVSRGVGPKSWIFLTGKMEELKKIAAGFMVALGENNPGLHSSKFILVDKSGRVRGFYDSQSQSQMDTLEIDARGLTA